MRELETREKRLLIFLGLALLGFAVFRLGPWLVGSLTGGVDAGGATAGRGPGGAGDDIVELTRLDPELRNYKVDRNPFVYGRIPAPPPPPRREPKPAPKPPPRREPKPPPVPVDTGPRPPNIDYVFVGTFGPRDRRIAVLSDDGVIYNVQEGDEVDGVVRVANIGFETIDLQYVDFPDVPVVKLKVGP